MTRRIHHVDPYHGFTESCSRRNLREWPYALVLYKDDLLLIETMHKTLFSLRMEVKTSTARIVKGEATSMTVDGIEPSVWKAWCNE